MRQPLLGLAIGIFAAAVAQGPLSARAESQTRPMKAIPPGGDIPGKFNPVREGFEYVKRDVMIPMRDGVKLHTVIVVPKAVTRGPMMLDRTPYSAAKSTKQGEDSPLVGNILRAAYAELCQAGYIMVIQDVRGKYGSGGDYVMNRPVKGPLNSTPVDHPTDTWDTIDWLIKNVPESNGRVGTIGTSYDGFTALMSLINPHPALKASVPINPMVDGWKGDDWFHNGALRQQMMPYVYRQTAEKDSGQAWFSAYYDDYAAFLHYGSAGAYGKAMGMEQLPFWVRWTQHPAYDEFWQEQAVDRILAKVPLTVPTLLVDSLWDQEDIYGAPAVYAAVKARADGNAHLVLGPWFHGQPNGEGSGIGALEWGADTGQWFRRNVMVPFLDSHLKEGAPAADIAPVMAFETGTNEWRRLSDWPVACPANCQVGMTPLYLGADQSLQLGTPAAAGGGYDEYISDPLKPVPYRAPPIRPIGAPGSTWKQWLVDDQRFAAVRPDVLVYRSEALRSPVKISGQPFVHLFASTSGTDSDWVVKLIDVYPDVVPEKPELGGYQFAVAMDVMRGRYRDDPARPSALPANAPVEYRFALPDANHVFLPGHRIMVQIQSSWFPLYDRNPQTYVKSIFFAEPGDYRKATQRVYHASGRQSYLGLPVVR